MFKIGEFSKITQVSIRMLRYYDEVDLLKPEKIDNWTGYRLYSANQIPLLNKIIELKNIGFTVKEISFILNNSDKNTFINELNRKSLEIIENINNEELKLRKLNKLKNDFININEDKNYNISLKSIPKIPVLSLRRIINNYYLEKDLWTDIEAFSRKNNILISTNTFSIYHDKEYKEENIDVEVCCPVNTLGKSQ